MCYTHTPTTRRTCKRGYILAEHYCANSAMLRVPAAVSCITAMRSPFTTQKYSGVYAPMRMHPAPPTAAVGLAPNAIQQLACAITLMCVVKFGVLTFTVPSGLYVFVGLP